MNKYDIWIEGWRATGAAAKAKKIGEAIEGNDFKSAVDAFSKTPLAEGFGPYNKDNMTFWGCRVFDNESSARKSFG